MTPLVLTVPELARELRIGRNQAYALVSSGEVQSVRVGHSIRAPRGELERLLGETKKTNAAVAQAAAIEEAGGADADFWTRA